MKKITFILSVGFLVIGGFWILPAHAYVVEVAATNIVNAEDFQQQIRSVKGIVQEDVVSIQSEIEAGLNVSPHDPTHPTPMIIPRPWYFCKKTSLGTVTIQYTPSGNPPYQFNSYFNTNKVTYACPTGLEGFHWLSLISANPSSSTAVTPKVKLEKIELQLEVAL